jgi:hypothetical protein
MELVHEIPSYQLKHFLKQEMRHSLGKKTAKMRKPYFAKHLQLQRGSSNGFAPGEPDELRGDLRGQDHIASQYLLLK